jgi:hypothetical protein
MHNARLNAFQHDYVQSEYPRFLNGHTVRIYHDDSDLTTISTIWAGCIPQQVRARGSLSTKNVLRPRSGSGLRELTWSSPPRGLEGWHVCYTAPLTRTVKESVRRRQDRTL